MDAFYDLFFPQVFGNPTDTSGAKVVISWLYAPEAAKPLITWLQAPQKKKP